MNDNKEYIKEMVKTDLEDLYDDILLVINNATSKPQESMNDVMICVDEQTLRSYIDSCREYIRHPKNFYKVPSYEVTEYFKADDPILVEFRDKFISLIKKLVDNINEDEKTCEETNNWRKLEDLGYAMSYLDGCEEFVSNPNAFAMVKESSMNETAEKGKNQYLDLTSCGVSIDKACKTLISELSDALAMDEQGGSFKEVSDDIQCLSYVQTVRDFAIREFTRCKGERNA